MRIQVLEQILQTLLVADFGNTTGDRDTAWGRIPELHACSYKDSSTELGYKFAYFPLISFNFRYKVVLPSPSSLAALVLSKPLVCRARKIAWRSNRSRF